VERLILFAKTPRLHQVKTRLAPRLTPEQALALHEAMLADQIRFVRSLEGERRDGELCMDASPPSVDSGLRESSQGEGDLGLRMHRALLRAFADGCGRAAILGADAPTLPQSRVEEAFALLRGGADAVIVPAEDGGYVFVGLSRPAPVLFESVPWGTASVLETTRRRAREAGLTLAETEAWPDVDVAADLPRLAAGLAADPLRAPATLAFMRGLGL
jgi:rSAM/selenodomain-associated transferase 1